MKEEIKYKVSFADSEFSSYTRKQNNLNVKIKAWNEVELNVVFQEVIGVADYGIGNISAFVKENIPSLFMERTLLEAYEKVPNEHNYKLYQLLNLDGVASFEVIAESFEII